MSGTDFNPLDEFTRDPPSGRIRDEISTYDAAPINTLTSELQVWDSTLYPATVREYEYAVLHGVIRRLSPRVALDVGCGPGWMTHFLAPRTNSAIGVDVSRSLLMNARKTQAQNESFIHADACRLPLSTGSVDLAISVGALHHLHQTTALHELKRVLVPAGELILLEPNEDNPIARVGRWLFPTETHTVGERPFEPKALQRLLVTEGWDIVEWETRFLFVFAISRILRRVGTRIRMPGRVVSMLRKLEEGCAASGLTAERGWIISCIARPRADDSLGPTEGAPS